MVTLRWKLGPRGSECAWVTKPEQSAPQGRVTTARSPPILLRPHSLEMGRLAKGHRKMPQSQDWIMVSAYVQMFSPLKKKKKKRYCLGGANPVQCPPCPMLGSPGTENRSVRSDPKPSAQPSPTHPFSGQLMGALATGRQAGTDKFPQGQPRCTSASHP